MKTFLSLCGIAASLLFLSPAARAQCTCATISVHPTTIAAPGGFLTVEVDDPVNPLFDCNGNNLNDDAGCDELFVRVASADEPEGEPLLLQRVGTGTTYRGTIGVSTKLDVPGVVFTNPNGTRPADVKAVYFDWDCTPAGPPVKCQNSCTDTQDYRGQIEATASVAVTPDTVVVRGTRIVDDLFGDGDGIPDDNETVELWPTLINKGATTLTGVKVRLRTESSELNGVIDTTPEEVDGVIQNEIDFPDMPPGVEVAATEPFTFHVGDQGDRVLRNLTAEDIFNIRFRLLLSANEIDAIDIPQELIHELDLDLAGGFAPKAILEQFESIPTFGIFEPMHLDLGLDDLTSSRGYRCSYRNPEECISSTYQDPVCHLGLDTPHNADFFWKLDGPAFSPDGGRAFSFDHSLYFGVHGSATPGSNTTPTGTMEAVRTTDPINIGWENVCEVNRKQICTIDANCTSGSCVPVAPELSFWHQLSLVDHRGKPIPAGESWDGAVVQVQRADQGAGSPLGRWETIVPYHNIHDVQRTASGSRCQFDPTDDENTEHSLDDSADIRSLSGPSSTCYATHVLGYQGDTTTFSPTALGRASDGPGVAGSRGTGTWVEARYNLERYRGLRIRLRFLVTTAKDATAAYWSGTGLPANSPVDDGWHIDDVRISDALNGHAFIAVDAKDNSGLPNPTIDPCFTVDSELVATPDHHPLGGGTSLLSAVDSSADRCVDGTLQYRFWVDIDSDNDLDGNDAIIRDWLDVPTFPVQVVNSTQLGVEVRCSSDPSCDDATIVPVTVDTTPGEATELTLSYEPSTQMFTATYIPACSATDHTLYATDDIAKIPTGDYRGQRCNIGTDGSHVFPDPGWQIVFWVVVGHDGVNEGPYGANRPSDTTNASGCTLPQNLASPCP